jgi:hypothetical protein
MRNYIFTPKELAVIEQYLRTGKRTPAFRKLLHHVSHNGRILNDVQIFLTLLELAKTKFGDEKPKLPPGRPSKRLKSLK